LVNLVAERIQSSGNIPLSNVLIDLAVRVNSTNYIFEIKTLSDDNIRNQLRDGLSQLYEYSYLQNLFNTKLVLVLERELP